MNRKLVVFDMDGVLVDVSGSYREAVRQGARLFFSRSDGFADLPDPLFPLEDLGRLKRCGGLNNDWDLLAQVLSLLSSQAAVAAGEAQDKTAAGVLPRLDVRPLAVYLRTTASPLMGLLARHGRRLDPRVEAAYRGDVADGNLVKGLFQEIYLGADLYRQVYGRRPRSWVKAGLIGAERLLVKRELLAAMARDHTLAIATGRPRVEAEVPLARFAVKGLFAQVLTLDDCLLAEERTLALGGQRVTLAKPHPFMLAAIARSQAGPFGSRLYLGDMPDDMHTATAAGFRGVGVLWSSPDRTAAEAALKRAGASCLLARPEDLIALVDRDS